MTKRKDEEKTFSPPSSFRLEAVRHKRGSALIVSGIVSITDFTSELIVLKGHGVILKVSGKRLDMTVFENNSLEITGRVEGIGFKYGKN